MTGAGCSSNVVQGNFLGTDLSGTIRVGNIWEGIYLEQASTNLIGGAAGGAGNVISGNYARGINFSNASWNVVQGNLVGTAADGTNNLGNQLHNVDLQLGSANNVIGGTAPGAGNRFAYAQGVYCGVRVRTGAANNFISGNAIFSNGALGIDLDPTSGGAGPGVNPIVACESGVAGNAANAGQNFPVLSNVLSGASTRVRGSLNSKVGRAYTLQFFASPTGDPSGYGEGQVYLGQTNLTLTAACSSGFTAYLPASVPPGWVVTATASDPNGNTSEFSAWISALTVPPLRLTATNGGALTLSWTNNGGSFVLQQTYSLTPPITWSPVTNAPVLANNFWSTTLRLSNLFASPWLLSKAAQQQLVLSWTNSGPNFVVEQSSSLIPPIAWSPVAATPALTNNLWTVTPTPTQPVVFYRLNAAESIFYRLMCAMKKSCRSALAGLIVFLFAANPSESAIFSTIVTNGPTTNRVNLVIFSEGYTNGQLATFLNDATNAANFFLAAEPYAEYSNHFNVFAIFTNSAHLGLDASDFANLFRRATLISTATMTSPKISYITIPPDPAFDNNPSHGQGKINALLWTNYAAIFPRTNNNLPAMLVNDPTAGGSDGGSSDYGKTAISSIGNVNNILVHESGHTLGNLGDEYTHVVSWILDQRRGAKHHNEYRLFKNQMERVDFHQHALAHAVSERLTPARSACLKARIITPPAGIGRMKTAPCRVLASGSVRCVKKLWCWQFTARCGRWTAVRPPRTA